MDDPSHPTDGTAEGELKRLVAIMAALRTPVTGCPWDLEQTFSTIAPYTIEEAYEVADAIERGDMVDLVDELGDLLLQVVFHARLAEEAGHFALKDAIASINAKMWRRHPHVFGDQKARDAGMAKGSWDAIKAAEKADKERRRVAAGQTGGEKPQSRLDRVTVALPALTRAVKLQDEAGKVGFDWNNARAVIAKIREELDEVDAALDQSQEKAEEEIGDLLFAVANLARHARVDPEKAVRQANAKFIRRFGHIERQLAARGSAPEHATLDEMEALWNDAKSLEGKSGE